MPKTLLLADDSVTMQKVVGITFANEDVQLVTVDNGDDALNRAREIRPDLVLADVGMPGLDGYSLCAALKNEPTLAHVKVILLTGTFDMYDEARAAEVGADAHVAKPFEAQALVEQVRQLLARPAPAGKRAAGPGPATAPARGASASAAAAGAASLSDPSRADFDLDFGDLDFEAAGSGGGSDAVYTPPPAPPAAANSGARSGPRATPPPPPPLPEDDRRFAQTMLLEAEEPDLMEGEMVEEAWPPGGPPPITGPSTARSGPPVGGSLEQTVLAAPPRGEPAGFASRGRGATPPAVITPPAPAPAVAAERDSRGNSSGGGASTGSRSAARRGEPLDPEQSAELGDELWDISAGSTTQPSASRRGGRGAEAAPEVAAAAAPWAEPLEDTQPPRSGRGVKSTRAAEPPAPAVVARIEPTAADREAIRETLEKVAWDAFGNISEQLVREVVSKVEQIAWEVIPVLSERLIREEIARLKGEPSR